jgi:Dot/Icm secretion system protein IcmQ
MVEHPEKENEQALEDTKQIVDILDNLLKHDYWESSFYLKVAKKRLNDIREDARAYLHTLDKDIEQKQMQEIAIPPGCIKAFISVYQSEGNSLKQWLVTLKSLIKHSVTRPVYRREQDVREIIRNKPDPTRLGYAVIIVNEKDILPLAKAPTDKIGHELIMLKENAIKVENIIEFVHANEKKYTIKNNVLIPKEES